MRKLTALTVALSLSAAAQAFAGPPHAPAAHGADASAARAVVERGVKAAAKGVAALEDGIRSPEVEQRLGEALGMAQAEVQAHRANVQADQSEADRGR